MAMDNALAGKIALVTGAGRGIGRACAIHLAGAGAHVIAVARTRQDLETLKSEAPGSIEPLVGDVTDNDFYARIGEFKTLDILVNNAGMNRPLAMDEVDDQTLDEMIGLNVRAVFKTSQAAIRVIVKGGKGGAIVNMSSQMAHVGGPKRTVYCMTKAAVDGLTRAMALEFAHHDIRVNAVAPTFVITPMTQPMLDDPEFKKLVFGSIPLGRVASVDDVAQAVVFLASPMANMITGISMLIDGGWTAQ